MKDVDFDNDRSKSSVKADAESLLYFGRMRLKKRYLRIWRNGKN